MWTILDLSYRTTDGTVKEITGEYRLTEEINGKTYVSRKIERAILDEPNSEDFINLEELTVEVVLAWLFDKVDSDAAEVYVAQTLQTLIDQDNDELTNGLGGS